MKPVDVPTAGAAQVGAVATDPPLATVVIGRNEGERLRRCLASVSPCSALVVYVDSGSTDGSVELARSLGAAVHALDLHQPFTAARARNAGWRAALARAPGLAAVQFVDGDCEVQPGWWGQAAKFLLDHPEVGVVCGRRRERHPDASFYNQVCDWEWDTQVGQTLASGGDACIRTAALQQVQGYRDDLIAGEEPELCVRLRAQGWTVWRLDAEMTLHDAAIHHFGQWWKRTQRAGHAFAEGAALHGQSPERHWVAERRRLVIWGLVLPSGLIVWTLSCIALGQPGWGLCGWLVYPAQALRLAASLPGPLSQRLRRAGLLVLGKFAEASGAWSYWSNRQARRRSALIEYK